MDFRRNQKISDLRDHWLSESTNLTLRMVLFMVQKSQTTTWDVFLSLVNNGINYQPQLVSRISEPSTVVRESAQNVPLMPKIQG